MRVSGLQYAPRMKDTPSSKVRERLLSEMKARELSQTDIAGLLGWSQPRVSKVLHGRVELNVDDLAQLCFAVGISMTEAVRDQGMEFCAEMTPTEFRTFERMRQLHPTVLDAIMTLLDVKGTTRAQERRAAAPRPKRGPRNR